MFFVATGGFDTHGGQLPAQVQLLQEVNDALSAFCAATVEMAGPERRRPPSPPPDFEGAHLPQQRRRQRPRPAIDLVVGSAVQEGGLFGAGAVPTLANDGPDDTGEGRWIPSTSVDEYSATLAKWFGVSASDMPTVFPNLNRFNNPDLGFMGA